MLLEVHHHRTFIRGEENSPEVFKEMRKALKIYEKTFRGGFNVIDLYYADKSFPTGFLEEFKRRLKKKEIEFKVMDKRKYPSKKYNLKHSLELRDWQEEASKKIEEARGGIISAPTGTGKSYIIYNTIALKNVKTLVLVPTISVQSQIYNEMKKVFGLKNVTNKIIKTEKKVSSKYAIFKEEQAKETTKKVLGSSYKELFGSTYISPEEEYLKTKKFKEEKKAIKKKEFKKKIIDIPITVLCYKSLELIDLEYLKEFEMVIVDECHHSGSQTIREKLDMMDNCAYRFGFSATPWRDKRHDHLQFIASMGEDIVFEMEASEAINNQLIARPDYRVIISPTPKIFMKKIKDWREIVEKGIIGNETRNEVIIKKAIEMYSNDHNVFICVDEISHMEILEKRFLEKGIKAIGIHGQKNNLENEESVKKVGETKGSLISIGTMSVGEGTNMPNISVVILAGYGKASTRFLQRIGRGTRKTKDTIIVFDMEDWFNATTMKHSKERQAIFKKYFGY